MTPAPCRVVDCIICIRPTYSCACAFNYLLTLGFERIKPIISTSKTFVEYLAKLTVNGLYEIEHRLSIAGKMYDLE